MLAVPCVLSAADRSLALGEDSRQQTAFGFGASAYRRIGERALAAGAAPLAIAAAAHAVAADPIDQRAVSLLGAAEAATGRADAAYAAFRVAGQLGWRDPLTQVYWFDQALAAGEFAVAAQRVDALLSAHPNDRRIATALYTLEASASGREALAQRLARSPAWLQTYLALSVMTVAQAVNRTAAISLAVRQGLPRDRSLAIDLAGTFLRLNEPTKALAIWVELLGRGSLDSTGLWDDDLGSIQQPSLGSFRWQSIASGSYQVQVVAAPSGGHALLVNSESSAVEVVAGHAVVLGTGTYRVDWRTRGVHGEHTDNLKVAVDCWDGASLRRSNIESTDDRRWQIFEVPLGLCPIATITIRVAPADMGQTPASLVYGVRLSRLGSWPLSNGAGH